MKNGKRPARKEKRAGRHGARIDSNGRRDRASFARGLYQPKTELESAIQRFVELYDFAPIAYISFDRAGRIEEANLTATELLGVPRDLLIGRPFAFYVADLDLFLQHLLYCRTSQQRVETELQLKPRKGEPIPAQLVSTPITSMKRNGALLYQTAIIDLTERKHAEESAMRLAAVVQWSHDAIATKTLNGIITGWNQSAERIFGYKPNEIIGKSVLTLIPKDRQHEEKEILRTVSRGESLDHYETVRRRKDGKMIDVSLTISPIKGANGEIIGISKIARDITKQKQTERRLAEQARLLDLSNEAILVRDSGDHITYWNNGAGELYGH